VGLVVDVQTMATDRCLERDGLEQIFLTGRGKDGQGLRGRFFGFEVVADFLERARLGFELFLGIRKKCLVTL
jgi:hypothetical protein